MQAAHRIAVILAAIWLAVVPTSPYAADETGNEAVRAGEHAEIVKLSYDAVHLAHSLQYHQARTMLALIGDYTRYDHAERITETNWFNSQIEELQLQLPRMRKRSEKLSATEEDRQQISALFDGLEALLAASRRVHAAIKSSNIETANQLYFEETDPTYNAVVAAAHSLISTNDRAISMIRLRAK